MSPEAGFWWGRVSPAPWPLLGPDRFERGPQALNRLAVGVPYAVDSLNRVHTCLLSARCSDHRADFFVFRVSPPDNDIIIYLRRYCLLYLYVQI